MSDPSNLPDRSPAAKRTKFSDGIYAFLGENLDVTAKPNQDGVYDVKAKQGSFLWQRDCFTKSQPWRQQWRLDDYIPTKTTMHWTEAERNGNFANTAATIGRTAARTRKRKYQDALKSFTLRQAVMTQHLAKMEIQRLHQQLSDQPKPVCSSIATF
eukprot:g75.t1